MKNRVMKRNGWWGVLLTAPDGGTGLWIADKHWSWTDALRFAAATRLGSPEPAHPPRFIRWAPTRAALDEAYIPARDSKGTR